MQQNNQTLVVFGAEWCQSCKTLKSLLSASEPSFVVQMIDVDTDMQAAKEYAVRGLPTVILFEEGEEKHRASGLDAVKLVNAMLGPDLTSILR